MAADLPFEDLCSAAHTHLSPSLNTDAYLCYGADVFLLLHSLHNPSQQGLLEAWAAAGENHEDDVASTLEHLSQHGSAGEEKKKKTPLIPVLLSPT